MNTFLDETKFFFSPGNFFVYPVARPTPMEDQSFDVDHLLVARPTLMEDQSFDVEHLSVARSTLMEDQWFDVEHH